MHVSIIFNEHFTGPLAGAVWLVDTPANRTRFNECADLTPNSALFKANRYETHQTALLYAIWHVEDHFPEMERISVIGIAPDPSTVKTLEEDYSLASDKDGFTCLPQTGSRPPAT